MEKAVYSVNDFCEKYALSRTYFYRRVKAGEISIIKRGTRTGVTHTEAERWLASLCAKKAGV